MRKRFLQKSRGAHGYKGKTNGRAKRLLSKIKAINPALLDSEENYLCLKKK